MHDSTGEKVFYAINYIVLGVIGLICLVPLLHIIALSFSDVHAVRSGFVTIFPVDWTIEAYDKLLQGSNVIRAFINNVIITVFGVVFSMFFTVLAAYPLSKKHFYARRFFTLAIVFTMLFNGGIIPTYLVVKSLGLTNSYGALWLPGLISTFNMLVMRTHFENLPDELEESAKMDGCGEVRYLMSIVLPLSMPMLATLTLFYGVGYWNSFFNVLIYINDTSLYNLTTLVQQMVQSQSILQEINNAISTQEQVELTPQSIRSAAIVILVAPMLVIYPFLQKYFVKGVLLGAIKQ